MAVRTPADCTNLGCESTASILCRSSGAVCTGDARAPTDFNSTSGVEGRSAHPLSNDLGEASAKPLACQRVQIQDSLASRAACCELGEGWGGGRLTHTTHAARAAFRRPAAAHGAARTRRPHWTPAWQAAEACTSPKGCIQGPPDAASPEQSVTDGFCWGGVVFYWGCATCLGICGLPLVGLAPGLLHPLELPLRPPE